MRPDPYQPPAPSGQNPYAPSQPTSSPYASPPPSHIQASHAQASHAQGQNAYGQNAPGQNPYSPPSGLADLYPNDQYSDIKEGTYGGGFAIGFIFALLGLLIVYLVAKPETKRGALHGLGARFALALLLGLFAVMLG